jgi:hypothetical protein
MRHFPFLYKARKRALYRALCTIWGVEHSGIKTIKEPKMAKKEYKKESLLMSDLKGNLFNSRGTMHFHY